MTRNQERDAAIRAAYESNKTLAQIGACYGITRERVRQLLERQGVKRRANGKKKQSD